MAIKYFIKVLLLTCSLSLILSAFLLKQLIPFPENENSWWAIIVLFTHFLALRFVLLLTLSSVTIFLNLFKVIRNNYFYSMMSFIGPPLLYFVWNLVAELIDHNFETSSAFSGIKFMAALSLPYLIIITFCFFHYRRWLRKQQAD